jgi:dienelactone hydrolase
MVDSASQYEPSSVEVGERRLGGFLTIPDAARALVIFAHGSGSSRFSPRNSYVAQALNRQGLATLQFDLLTEEEAADRRNVFDIPLLSERVVETVEWAKSDRSTRSLDVGLFGASTGAASALVAAANLPGIVSAVVSRGGRPDLASSSLGEVRAPTLLIVGGLDYGVIELNEEALAAMNCEKELLIVPGATHLFEEPGTLDQVVDAATGWFKRYFARQES